MFSYLITDKSGKIVVESGLFANCSEMIIDAGKHMQKDENTSELREDLILKKYENGMRIR